MLLDLLLEAFMVDAVQEDNVFSRTVSFFYPYSVKFILFLNFSLTLWHSQPLIRGYFQFFLEWPFLKHRLAQNWSNILKVQEILNKSI